MLDNLKNIIQYFKYLYQILKTGFYSIGFQIFIWYYTLVKLS